MRLLTNLILFAAWIVVSGACGSVLVLLWTGIENVSQAVYMAFISLFLVALEMFTLTILFRRLSGVK